MIETQMELEKKHREDYAELRAINLSMKSKHDREHDELKSLKGKQNNKIGDEGF